MYTVIFKLTNGEDVTVFAACNENLLKLALKENIYIDAPCSGNGTCGKCLVRIENQSHLDPLTVLACQTAITNDMIVHVLDTAHSYITNITTEIISNKTNFTLHPEQSIYGCHSESVEESFPVCNPDQSIYGLAIDIGTTTVSAMLVDISAGEPLVKATTGNAQIRYGADVINRIIEQQKPGGIKKLQDAIIKDTLLPLIDNLCATAGIPCEKITQLTVAANTTMNHLLLGIDAGSIRLEPYEPAFLEFPPYDPASIGINAAPDAKLILAPNIGSYVGGDITAGISVVAPLNNTLFIDLGTNGEIVFGNNEFMMACACSAGPAFEGGDISCGMRATTGAIEKIKINNETLEPEFTVIGNTKPAGICGTGLIDLISELFRTKQINKKGKLCHSELVEESFPVYNRIQFDEYGSGSYTIIFAKDSATGKDITITETDIDNFIRAKAAIFSGIISLLEPLGLTPADIDDVLIAGGIGSAINIKNAISIGMLPDLPEEKYSNIGNASLNGAYAMLTIPQGDEIINEIAGNMTYINLSTQPDYMNAFIAACFLPHTDETLFPSLN